MASAIIVLILVWALHLLPFAFMEWRMWGFDHLLFLSRETVWSYIVLGVALGAGLAINGIRARIVQGYDRTAKFLLADRYRVRWIILSILALILFWLCRLPINLLGDARIVTANVGDAHPVFYKWSQMGAIFVAHTVSQLLSQSGLELGRATYQIISVISGAVTLYFILAIAYSISSDIRIRLLTLGLFIFSGWTLLFFGYVENYPILWPLVTAYIYSSLMCLHRSRFPLIPALIILVATVMHVQIVCFLPSLAYLMYEYYARRINRPGKAIRIGLVAIVIAVSAAVLILAYRQSLDIRLLLVGVGSGHPGTPDYTLFSLTHLWDIANQFLLLIPILPASLVIAFRRPMGPFEALDLFLLFFSIGGFIFLFGIEPGLGMARDWDLFALAGLGPLLFLIRRIKPPESKHAFLLPALVLLSALMTSPFWMTAMRTDSAMRHYTHLLNLDLPRSRAGITILRDIYSERGDSAAVDSLNQVMADAYPAYTLVPLADRMIDAGEYRQALEIADSLYTLNPYSIETLNLRGMAYLYLGDHKQALENLQQAADLGRYDSRILVNVAQAHFMVGNYEEVMTNLRRAQALAPESFYVIEALATVRFRRHQYDSAYVYALRMIEADSLFPAGYSLAGLSALNRGDSVRARTLLSHFLTISPDGKNKDYIDSIVREMQ